LRNAENKLRRAFVWGRIKILYEKLNKEAVEMAKFLMLGKYSVDGVKGIAAERTQKVVEIIQKSGGKVNEMYALLGRYDISFVVDFPGNADVMKASIAITKLTGIGFTTCPAIPVEEFDKILG